MYLKMATILFWPQCVHINADFQAQGFIQFFNICVIVNL